VLILIPLAGLLCFLPYFVSLRHYINYGSLWFMLIGALVQPLSTAVLLTSLLAVYAEISPAHTINNDSLQLYSTIRVFAFAALCVSSPLAFLSALVSIRTKSFKFESKDRQAAFDAMIIRLTASVFGCAAVGATLLIVAAQVG